MSFTRLLARLCLAIFLAILSALILTRQTLNAQTVRIETAQPTNTFVPNQALGAGIDRIQSAAAD